MPDFNIPDGVSVGDSGQIQWARNIAAAVNLLGPNVPATVLVTTGTEARPDFVSVTWRDLREDVVVPDDAPTNMVDGVDEWKVIGGGAPSIAAPNLSTATIPALTQGTAMTPTVLTNTGGVVASVTTPSGTVPAGLTVAVVSGQVQVSGTPTGSGAFTFTVRATNSAGSSDRTLTGTIAASGGGPSGGAAHSVFTGSTAPFTLVRAEDGTPNIEIATGFYGSAVAGDLLTKVRLFIPAGTAPSSVAIRAYHPAVNGAPTLGSDIAATATIASPVAGAWNEATLNTPVTLVNNRIVWVSYDAGGGVYYAATGAIPGGGPVAAADGYLVLSDAQPYASGAGRRNHFRIGTGSTSPNTNTWYGLDVVVEEA